MSKINFELPEDRKIFRHTSAHILAQAVKRLYPDAKLAIGPAIDNGFYYDFDVEKPFSPEDLEKIEIEMKKIIKENLKLKRFVLPKEEAVKLMREKGEVYKIELIGDLDEGEEVSFYEQGDFVDLCAGPHLDYTSSVKAFKLLNATGAYWKGSEKNKMLTRIYGVSYPNKAALDEYLERLEEAKRRDHNKIGRELELFTTVDYIGQGLPIMMPKGAKVLQILQRFVEDEEEKRGYLLTKTPFMAKSDLYKISGHWEHYRDGMFSVGDAIDADGGNTGVQEKKEALALRPMTCPFQFQYYLAKMRSYRDLPMRFNETSYLFRNEASGEMHGLIRVRQFTLSEGHIACRDDQLEEEFAGCLDLARFMLTTLGLEEDISYRFSKWDANNKDKYIGDSDEWERVQDRMRVILDDLKLDYYEADGEAAFYGPKLDLQIKNVHGKEDTLITLQIDFQLASKFGMEYVDSDGTKKNPYVIHRSSIGCYERTLALLIEKYAGAFPAWLAPVQIKILPIGSNQHDYAYDLNKKMRGLGLRVEVDDRNEKIGYKIREAQSEKIPYMLIVGDKELENNTVSVRSRKKGELGAVAADDFIRDVLEEVNSKAI
ncbi:MAG: threonine--tRNA ligase [Oscillospiraceae bacterium]|nr:threonine--tRNA ligase [Oscillospiraceae bacterium]